jgi:hypothetical protein
VVIGLPPEIWMGIDWENYNKIRVIKIRPGNKPQIFLSFLLRRNRRKKYFPSLGNSLEYSIMLWLIFVKNITY